MDRSKLYRRFRTLLIANRGEIACRVIRTARAMGLRTVAVYSEADRGAMHVALADEAVLLGPARARDSYLNVERLIEAARKTGAEAIHPGYGFLSENAEFARACFDAGLVFVGPTAGMMTAMGSKSGSKALMEKAGVPLVPGYHGEAQDDATLAKAADKVGFPILVKASAGGGGRGMRIVRSADELAPAIVSAKREAKAAFGDDRMLIEKYVDNPRHIEVQVIGDSHGNLVSLFERECTLQRRHQKVIEEAPSPTLNPAQREAVCAAARKAAGAVNYVGAGTIEFVSDGKDVFFIEMNTRLQVEHPVTELITGIDLVEWQLRVAFGEALPLKQDEIRFNGHAVEARVYAENPTKNFMPSVGKLSTWRMAAETGGLRIDAGYREGDTVSPYYDAMLAKMIAWGADAGCRDRAAEPRSGRVRRPRHRHQHPVPVGPDNAFKGAGECDRHRLHRTRAGGSDASLAGTRRARALRRRRRCDQRRAAGCARRRKFAVADLWLDAGRPPPAQLCVSRRSWTRTEGYAELRQRFVDAGDRRARAGVCDCAEGRRLRPDA
ncbi:acetyl/propionyl-CoA carboxylase alpha subunit [Bradyrhizobium sp. LM3.4]